MFVLSKLLAVATQPLFWLALWGLAGLVALAQRRKAAPAMLWAAWVVGVGLGFEAVPDALLRPLEQRHPAPGAQQLGVGPPGQEGTFVGVIVLGGAFERTLADGAQADAPLRPRLNAAAERMTASTALMRQNPAWTLVFTGGDPQLRPSGASEAQLAHTFYRQQGLADARIRLEPRARNTRENAQNVAQLLGAQCQERWLLVTSAWHMPRAMREFEAAGCAVTPYPTDFRAGDSTPIWQYAWLTSVHKWELVLHEHLGLLAHAPTR